MAFFSAGVQGLVSWTVSCLLLITATEHRVMGGSLDHHHRQLMEARVDDLLSRLASPWDFKSLAHRKIDLEPMSKIQIRSIAGVSIARYAVRLRGQAGLVLSWLSDASLARVLFKPPFELRAEPGMGRPVVVDVVLWKVGSNVFASGVSDEELTKLRDDLLWHEEGLKDSISVLALMESMVDFEQVHLQRARLEKGILSVRAFAIDERSKKVFQSLLEVRAKALIHAPKLDMDVTSPYVSNLSEENPPGLTMKECPVHDAVSAAGIFWKKDFILISKKDALLSGKISGLEPSGLFHAVIEKTAIPHEKVQNILVASRRFKQDSVAMTIDSKESLSLSISGMDAPDVLRRVGRVAKVQVIVSDDVTGVVSAKLHGVSGGRLLSILAWALGLEVDDFDNLVVMYSGSIDGVPLKSTMGKVSVNAYHAPVVEIVKLLAGLETLDDCGDNSGKIVDLLLGPVDSSQLLNGLLRGYAKKIVKDKKGWKLVDAGQHRAGLSSCHSGVDQSQKLRLYAIVRSGKKSYALMEQGGRFSWFSRGDTLGKARHLARIHRERVVMQDADGQTVQVFLGPDGDRHVPEIRPGPTRQGLGDLRLVGTLRLPEKFSLALVRNLTGDVFVLIQGQGIGRRCGKVTFIGSDRIGIRLECAVGKEPKKSTLYLGAKQ